ncbi:alpha/beta hydrolase [Acidaminobacterium chupaoyuni]
MAINKLLLSAIRALSYPDLDVKHHYRLMRRVEGKTHYRYRRPTFRAWDEPIMAEGRSIPTRVFAPMNRPSGGILLFFHGGGWVHGSIDSYDKVCAGMAETTGQTVVSVDYRLAPEFPYPAALKDCYAAAKALICEKQRDGGPVTLIGDSAGGNLAAAVSLLGRDRGDFIPKQQILIYPATYNDHSPSSPFASIVENGTDYLLTSKRICDYMDLYAPLPETRQSPYFAPLLADDFSRQPDTLVITAQFDPLRDEGEAYGEALRAAGSYVEVHRIPDVLHGFFALPQSFPPVADAFAIINHFLSGERYE